MLTRLGRAALVGLGLLSGGCATVVVPPVSPEDPQTVFLLDHGRHASLVLPHPPDQLVRYAYGDWAYYALNRTSPIHAVRAVLWPSQAGLGRRELLGPAVRTAVQQQVTVPITQLEPIPVGGAAVSRLRNRLFALHRANLQSKVNNPLYDLQFVHHPQPYTAFHNSNRVVAGWLEELGCRIRGPALFSQWRVETPE